MRVAGDLKPDGELAQQLVSPGGVRDVVAADPLGCPGSPEGTMLDDVDGPESAGAELPADAVTAIELRSLDPARRRIRITYVRRWFRCSGHARTAASIAGASPGEIDRRIRERQGERESYAQH